MNRRKIILQQMPYWLDQYYLLGSVDCLQLIWQIYPNLPKEYKDLNSDNYVEMFMKDRKYCEEIYYQYIHMYFEETSFATTGDIVEVRKSILPDVEIDTSQYIYIYGIYLDNNKAIFINEDDKFRILPLYMFNEYTFLKPKEGLDV